MSKMKNKTAIFAVAAVVFATFAAVSSFEIRNNDHEYELQMSKRLARMYETAPLAVQEDSKLPVPQLIEKYGYPAETHYVTTIDGYILCMHRIPYGRKGPGSKPRKPFFVQHGLLSSSVDWLISGPEKALGYILADMGYDVWLGNFRGNKYSRNHTYLNPDRDESFWDYSWHEMGVRDLPAMIDYVLKTTEQDKLFHVGHSQGTTTFYVMTSELPEYNDKILAHFSLAPIAYMKDMTSPLMQFLAFFKGPVEALLSLIGFNEFNLPNELLEKMCHDSLFGFLCTNSLFVVCGFNYQQLNSTLLPIIMAHTPAGSSVNQFIHYAQLIRSGYFRRWDHGLLTNMKKYGSVTPPDYKLKKITAPVYLIYSKNDWLSAESDVGKLYKGLNNCKGKFLVADNKWNHLDYLFGIDAFDMVYKKVVSLASRH